MIIRAILEWDEETRSHSATCPELNLVSSCGDTKEEAIANLQEAIALLLEPLPDELLDLNSSEAIELPLCYNAAISLTVSSGYPTGTK